MDTRRHFLRACVPASIAALAGCASDEGTTDSTSTTDATTPTATAPVEPSPTPTRTTQPATSEYTPPEYVDPDSYTETDVSLRATETCDLGATLSVPDRGENVPGVVIVHGSGSQDRNGTYGGLQPYRDLALGLASEGIATIRYDKRTHACSLSVEAASMTIDDEVTEDALTALDRLRDHDRVDAESVAIAGHSLGGMMAPRIADRDENLAGAAMLAPPARSLPELLVYQTRYRFERDGDLTDGERERLDRIASIADRVAAGEVGEDELIWGGGRAYWRSLAEYDQREAASHLSTPLLLQQGLGDKQVPPEIELSRWRGALGDRESVTIRTYDGLNHFFVAGPGPLETGELPDPGHVAEPVVADLADWIATVTD